MIPLSVPHIAGNELRYVKECLETGWVSSVGSFVDRFEKAVAALSGRKYAVACVNGTSALHLALLSLKLEPGDEVIVPALTFAAPANAIRYAGCYPVFIDVDKEYWQIDPQKLSDFLYQGCVMTDGQLINRATNRKVKALMPVHLLGHSADMDALLRLAREFKLKVIEDAAESIGSLYKGRPVGHEGDIACYSFNGNKIITCGGGGMLVTDDESAAARAKYLSTQAKDDGVEYIHHEIGYNYRLTNLQAAVGLAQLEMLPAFVQKKQAIARRYSAAFASLEGLTLPGQASWSTSTFWLYTVLVDESRGKNSRELMKVLADQGIQTRPLWHPLHTLKPFKDAYAFKITITDQLYRQALSLPSSVALSEADQDKVIAAVTDYIKGVKR